MKRPTRVLGSLLLALILPMAVMAGAGKPAGVEVQRIQGVVPAKGSPDARSCGMSESEYALLTQLLSSPDQRRPGIRCDATLQSFARGRAQDMANRGYFGHLTPERLGPNELLRAEGYPLPSAYGGMMSNSVEAIIAGYSDVQRVWKELMDSAPHRKHVLGEVDFFREQDEIGIAHVHDPDSDYGDYWVIVLARRTRAGEPRYLCSPEPAFCFIAGEEDGT